MNPSNTNTCASLKPIILSKISTIRDYFLDYGISQAQIQQYFLKHVFGCDLEEGSNTSQKLITAILKITSIAKAEELLQILDQESSKVENLKEIEMEEMRYVLENGFRIKKSEKSERNEKKRREKRVKDREDVRKKKEKKVKKSKENEQPQSQLQLQEGELKTPEEKIKNKQESSNIFAKVNANPFDSNAFSIISRSFGNPFSQNAQNIQNPDLKEYRDARESQRIGQKILQLQFLSNMMCSESEEERNENMRIFTTLANGSLMKI